jgi:hypothetical protein
MPDSISLNPRTLDGALVQGLYNDLRKAKEELQSHSNEQKVKKANKFARSSEHNNFSPFRRVPSRELFFPAVEMLQPLKDNVRAAQDKIRELGLDRKCHSRLINHAFR